MTTWDAGMSVTADRLNDTPRKVAEGFRTTTSAAVTTVETVIQSLTFNVTAGVEYKVTANSAAQCDVAAGSGYLQLRHGDGTSVLITDTSLDGKLIPAPVANLGIPFVLLGFFTPGTSGQWTVGVTMVRNNGTGNWTSFGSARQVNYLLVERAG